MFASLELCFVFSECKNRLRLRFVLTLFRGEVRHNGTWYLNVVVLHLGPDLSLLLKNLVFLN